MRVPNRAYRASTVQSQTAGAEDVSLRVVRVDAAAYDTFRLLGERELRDGFRFRRQYRKEMYDGTRSEVAEIN